MSTINELKQRANIIKAEETQGANTAPRVGSLLYDMIDYMNNIPSGGSVSPTEKTSVTVSPLLTRGVHIANINVDGHIEALWAPSSGGSINPYDDSGIWDAVDKLDDSIHEVQNTITNESRRLDNAVNGIDTTVSSKVSSLLNDSSWIQNNFPEQQVTWQSGWNAQIEAYLQQAGVWARNGGVTRTQWTSYTQKVDEIISTVNNIKTEGEIVEALQSSINQSVQNGIASLNLESTYAKKNAENVLEWMYSALKNSSSADKTFSQLVSSGKSGLTSAVSEIRTQIEKLNNGDYVATANLESKVNDTISGLYSRASSSQGYATLFSTIKKNAEDIAAIVTSATNDSSTASIAAKFANFRAGLVTTSNLDSAFASLIATSGTTASGLVTKSTLNNALAEIRSESDMNKAMFKTVVDDDRKEASAEILAGYYEGGLVNGTSRALISKGHIELAVETDGSGYGNSILIYPGKGGIVFTTDMDVEEYISYLFGGRFAAPWVSVETLRFTKSVTDASPSAIATMTADDDTIIINANKGLQTPAVTSSDNLFITSKNGEINLNSTENINMYAPGVSGINLQGYSVRIQVGYNFISNKELLVLSDERLKDIKKELNPSIEDIAKARIVDYTIKDNGFKEELGSIAQDWQEVFPNAVNEGSDGYLGLNYGSVALASAVAAAREIVKLKEENRALRERLERLEKAVFENNK